MEGELEERIHERERSVRRTKRKIEETETGMKREKNAERSN